jgi:hypothetical protein
MLCLLILPDVLLLHFCLKDRCSFRRSDWGKAKLGEVIAVAAALYGGQPICNCSLIVARDEHDQDDESSLRGTSLKEP